MQETWDTGLVLGLGRSPGVGNGTPLQYSCLGNPMTEEPGGLPSVSSQRVGCKWSNFALTIVYTTYITILNWEVLELKIHYCFQDKYLHIFRIKPTPLLFDNRYFIEPILGATHLTEGRPIIAWLRRNEAGVLNLFVVFKLPFWESEY